MAQPHGQQETLAKPSMYLPMTSPIWPHMYPPLVLTSRSHVYVGPGSVVNIFPATVQVHIASDHVNLGPPPASTCPVPTQCAPAFSKPYLALNFYGPIANCPPSITNCADIYASFYGPVSNHFHGYPPNRCYNHSINAKGNRRYYDCVSINLSTLAISRQGHRSQLYFNARYDFYGPVHFESTDLSEMTCGVFKFFGPVAFSNSPFTHPSVQHVPVGPNMRPSQTYYPHYLTPFHTVPTVQYQLPHPQQEPTAPDTMRAVHDWAPLNGAANHRQPKDNVANSRRLQHSLRPSPREHRQSVQTRILAHNMLGPDDMVNRYSTRIVPATSTSTPQLPNNHDHRSIANSSTDATMTNKVKHLKREFEEEEETVCETVDADAKSTANPSKKRKC